jgi:RNA polymerase sigma-70 factor, ECF subfamily
MTFLPLADTPEQNSNDLQVWVARALTGDQHAFAQLYERFASGLYRLCYSLLLNQEDAEDVAQEAFVYAFRNLARFDQGKSSFKTWLYTIAVSRCRNHYRRKIFPTLELGQLLQWDIPAPNSETPEAQLTQRSARETIQKALAMLSPQLREAIVLRYGLGLAYREIGEVMGCPAKTAESRVRLAHKQLHHLLQPVGQGLLEELLRI